MNGVLEIDAHGERVTPDMIMRFVCKLKTDANAAELFWRTDPTVAYLLVAMSVNTYVSLADEVAAMADEHRSLFADTCCGIPLVVEWDAPTGVLCLRDKNRAIGRIFNFPKPLL